MSEVLSCGEKSVAAKLALRSQSSSVTDGQKNKVTIRFAVQKGSVDVLMPTDTVQAEVWT